MAKSKPRKGIVQPTLPTPKTPTYFGQPFPQSSDPLGKSGMDWLKSISDQIPSGGGVIPPGGSTSGKKGTNATNPNDMDDSWSSILGHNAGDDGFLQWLASQGFGGSSDPNDAWTKDFNNFILQKMVEYGQLKEDRAYNRGLQLDQRIYDSPTNQLARLMGAGISRDAALQMISGSGGSGGSGVPYSQPFGAGDASAPSQSKLNEIQAGTSIAGTVFNGISALCGLTSLGLSVPQSMMQIDMMANQRFMSDKQRQAYEAASAAFSVLNSAGVENAADVFGSVGNTISTLQKLAASGNEAASAFIQNGGVQMLQSTSPYSSPMLSQMYQNERQAGDYALNFDQQIGLLRSQEELNKVNQDQVRQQILNLQQEYLNLQETEEYIKATTALQKASEQYQKELAKSQSFRRRSMRAEAERDFAQARNLDALTSGQELDNNIMRQLQNSRTADGRSGLSWMTDATLNRLMNYCQEANYARNNKEWEHRINKMLADYDCAESLFTLQKFYYDGTLEFLETNGDNVTGSGMQFKDLIYMCRAFDDNGTFHYLNSVINANTAGSWKVGPFSGSSNAFGSWGTPISIPSYKPTKSRKKSK